MSLFSVWRIIGLGVSALLIVTLIAIVVLKFRPNTVMHPLNSMIKKFEGSETYATAEVTRTYFPSAHILKDKLDFFEAEIKRHLASEDQIWVKNEYGFMTKPPLIPELSELFTDNNIRSCYVVSGKTWNGRRSTYAGFLTYCFVITGKCDLDENQIIEKGQGVLFDNSIQTLKLDKDAIVILVDIRRNMKGKILDIFNRGFIKVLDKLKIKI